MAQSTLPQPAHSGQTLTGELSPCGDSEASPATPLQIQRTLTALRRQLADSDAAVLRLFAERHELQEAITAETVRYQDAVNAGELQRQGAAAVGAAENIIIDYLNKRL